MAKSILYNSPSAIQVFSVILKMYFKIKDLEENNQNYDKIHQLSELAKQWHDLEFSNIREDV